MQLGHCPLPIRFSLGSCFGDICVYGIAILSQKLSKAFASHIQQITNAGQGFVFSPQNTEPENWVNLDLTARGLGEGAALGALRKAVHSVTCTAGALNAALRPIHLWGQACLCAPRPSESMQCQPFPPPGRPLPQQ